MREIKFRVWAKQSSKMRYNCDLYLNLHAELHVMIDIVENKTIYKLEQDDFEIMQYVGKDKNKKDVYEKDIVKMFVEKVSIGEYGEREVDFSCEYIGKVATGLNGVYLKNIYIQNESLPHGVRDLDGSFISTIPRNKKLVLKRSEVIGNIWENFELLEGKK